jgi:transcriptional regulator with XRE-family HTH domain
MLPRVLIGAKLREIREAKSLSQGDIELRTGLLRCYISRVENGHTVPSIGTLEKYAKAYEAPVYRFFLHGKAPRQKPKLPATKVAHEWGASGGDQRELHQFTRVLSRLDDPDRPLLMKMAARMVNKNGTK